MYTTPEPTQPDQAGKQPAFWRNRDFLLLWSGQVVSVLGTNISKLALPLLVLALTNSPAQAGLLLALRLLPYLVFSLPVGALIDRWDRKAVMIRCEFVRWLALGSVPLAFVLGHLTLIQLCLVAFIEGTAYVFFSIAQLAALPQVVSKEQIAPAYALSESTEAAGTTLGPGLSGLIIGLARTAATGAIIAYLLDSISYLVSAATLRSIRRPFQEERAVSEQSQGSLWSEILEGLRFLWQQRRLRILVLLTTAINLLQSPISLLIIVQAGRLQITPFVLGLILGIGGVGGLLGGLIAPWTRAHLRFGQVIIGVVILWAVSAVLLANAGSAPLLFAGVLLMDLLWPVYSVVVVSYRLTLAPDYLQGRLTSSFRFLTYGCEPFGPLLGGLLLALWEPRTLFWLIGLGLMFCALLVSCTEIRRT